MINTGSPNRVELRERLFARLTGMLDRNRLSNGGPLVQEFESRVADLSGTRHAIATCNATSALQMMLRAHASTGEVVMPSFTFPATAHAAAWIGLEPVFCDVDARTANLDPRQVPAMATARTAAVLGVHLWGRPCDAEALTATTSGRWPLLFDAAHAFGCTSGGRPVGTLGRASVFSFHATKVVSAFEGGAIVTDDDALAAELRSLRYFAFDAPGPATVGTNAKMSEAAAAMGLTSLDSFADVIAHNEVLYDRYATELAGVSGVRLLGYDRNEKNNFQYVVIEVDAAPESRDLLETVLRAENVGVKRYFSPACHQLGAFRAARRTPMPHTEGYASRVLALPTGTSVSADEVSGVCSVVRVAMSTTAAPATALGVSR
jgi:dTDP-4-amino-4,6-dideoxyglucose